MGSKGQRPRLQGQKYTNCTSVCLSIYLSIYLSINQYIYIYVYYISRVTFGSDLEPGYGPIRIVGSSVLGGRFMPTTGLLCALLNVPLVGLRVWVRSACLTSYKAFIGGDY